MRYSLARKQRQAEATKNRATKIQMSLDEARGVLRDLEEEARWDLDPGMRPVGDDEVTRPIALIPRRP